VGQHCHEKGLASIEKNLMNACNSITLVKFDGKLEAVALSTIKDGKGMFSDSPLMLCGGTWSSDLLLSDGCSQHSGELL
jgi:hypothetical protein